MRSSINKYCAAIGADPLLVQGAGGNVSWKSGSTLWIKASGTWLADAETQDIFVPVDLEHLRNAIAKGNFSVTPKLAGASTLKPSIETLLHALMPHNVVVHLHAIEVLAHLVRPDSELELEGLLCSSDLKWKSVAYFKPGSALASVVFSTLEGAPELDVVFLLNHGVVIGGADIAEIDHILKKLITALAEPTRRVLENNALPPPIKLASENEYFSVADPEVQLLAVDLELFDRLEKDWNLYPDHVVFLGARPECFSSLGSLQEYCSTRVFKPDLLFIRGLGVFTQPGFGAAKKAQLRCFYDVIVRQRQHSQLNTLSEQQISELLNWDAEQYRQLLSKNKH